jgi:hypothetical protein
MQAASARSAAAAYPWQGMSLVDSLLTVTSNATCSPWGELVHLSTPLSTKFMMSHHQVPPKHSGGIVLTQVCTLSCAQHGVHTRLHTDVHTMVCDKMLSA